MKITDALLGEHGVFYAQFKKMEGDLTAASLDHLRGQADLLAAALIRHAQMENEILFAALQPSLGEVGPIGVMRREHEEIERNLIRLAEVEDLPEAQRLLLQTIGLARDHFAKEEQILFRLAEQVLPPDALEEMAGRWARERGVSR